MINIERAAKEDISYLCALYRECFPDDTTYQSYFGYLRKWLIYLVSSQHAEVYIIKEDNKNVGTATLVLEHELHYEKKEIYNPPLLVKMVSVASKRVLLLSILNRIINRAKFTKRNKAVDINVTKDRKKSAWVDPIAITEPYRNKGYAKYLLDYLEKRSILLKYGRISLWVDKKNENAIRLYTNCNYHRSSMTEDGYIYKKVLFQ